MNKRRRTLLLTITALIALHAGIAQAANIDVTNVTIAAGAPAGQTYVQCDISWDASWRASWVESGTWTNWDAAWVFVKYRQVGALSWSHGTLSTNDSDHTVPAGAELDVGVTGTNGMGVFLYRAAEGFGSWTNTGVKLRWLYAADGVANTSQVDVCVHAIEMVYVPQGSFEVGDGTALATFYEHPTVGNSYSVTTEDAINVGDTAGYLNYTTGGSYGDGGTPIPAAFPKGYNAFYCMKYEISQGQYADFLNQLSSGDAATRYPNQNGNYRHTIGGSWLNYSASAPDRACNYLSWADGAAYADWSGLRPMTELEFEKACRGPLASVAGEYAWGNATLVATTSITDDGTGTATANPASANCNYHICSPDGPYRCGIYADASSDRTTAGSTYWGIMEMSGSLWERPVTVGNATGRGFTGLHGDGELSDGSANVANWPGSGATGTGRRGGAFGTIPVSLLRASDRNNAAYTHSGRYYSYGWRGVRGAP